MTLRAMPGALKKIRGNESLPRMKSLSTEDFLGSKSTEKAIIALEFQFVSDHCCVVIFTIRLKTCKSDFPLSPVRL